MEVQKSAEEHSVYKVLWEEKIPNLNYVNREYPDLFNYNKCNLKLFDSTMIDCLSDIM